MSLQSKTLTPVEFDGKAGEYFGIWFVNIALTIITLGIYSAWAKVRTNQYFYANTSILGSSFEYLATGWQILKGRLIAVLALVIVQLASGISAKIGIALAIALLVAIPWLINSGLRFTARMSAWRGVQFDFQGSYLGALLAFIVYPLIGVLTLWIAMPWAIQKSAKYIVEGHSIGHEDFQFSAKASHYYSGILGLIILFLVALIIALVGVSMGNPVLSGVGFLMFYGVAFAFKPVLFNIYWNHVSVKGNDFKANMGIGKYIWIFISNSVVVAISLGLMFPWSKVRMAKFFADSLEVADAGNSQDIIAKAVEEKSALGEELGEAFDVDVGFGA